jgi:hypothetical protein
MQDIISFLYDTFPETFALAIRASVELRPEMMFSCRCMN